VRAPEHAIPAPPFPRELTWVNVAPLRMDKQRGPVATVLIQRGTLHNTDVVVAGTTDRPVQPIGTSSS
jgi:hypothetical protein